MGRFDVKSEYQGRWWILDKPEHKVHGILKLNKYQLATLELNGSLKIEGEEKPGVIIGEAPDGTTFTLVDILPAHAGMTQQVSDGFIKSETRRIQTIFVNGRWDEREKIGFQHLQIRFRDLETWSGYDPFRWDSYDGFKERSLQIKPWKGLTLFQDDCVTIDLENGTSEFSSWGGKGHDQTRKSNMDQYQSQK